MVLLDPKILIGLFALLNLWTFMLFGVDKLRAEARAWRISESTLLGWAFVGGTIGAYLGRHVFRHKARKAPFIKSLNNIAIGQAVLIAATTGFLLG